MHVFEEPEDYEYFEDLMCFYAKSFGIIIHNYCLMSNHYHLLIEITQQNLSKFMRQLSMGYSIYFNKKNKRTGHLWQGRFKSWYVTDEAYFYTLMCYIEQNPLKANMIEDIREYPYSSYHYFLDYENIPECLQNAWIVQNYKEDTEAIEAFLTVPVDSEQLAELKTASSLVEAPNVDKKPDIEKLKKRFSKKQGTKERNVTICKAYKEGYSQHMIAKVLGLAQSTVSAIVKRGMK
ncbi:transposase [Sulfurovum sp. NBC37-1]|uniref:transposase n=1 Tax=Sulfurovum sp. (strain NBC37-1) TaxID=387093 RepID=UPI0002DB7566|nr:transposase [Sulfurovum sp. NBC37-1]